DNQQMTYYSCYPEVEIPTSSIYDYIFSSLKNEELERIAVVDGALHARGIQQGDVIALHAPNCLGFIIAFHGILRAGATVTTLNVLYSPTEISSQINDSNAKLCITTSMFLSHAVAGVTDAGLDHKQIIVLDHAENYVSMAELISHAYWPPEYFVHAATYLAVLPYSSGTTGKAKGVMLTHHNLIANIAQCSAVLPIREDDTVLAVLPFFHIYGMNVIMNLTLQQRGKLVILPKFDLKPFLELIQNEKCSSIYIAPPIAVALTKHPLVKEYDLSSIRTIVCGAAPMDEALGAALTEQIPASLLQGFVGSIGFAIPNISFKVVDPQTGDEIEKVPNGRTQAGEMLIKGPNVMVGYLNNQEATNATITTDGYLHTGDIVEVGPQGEVYVVDRLKELIKYKGYQVPPAELEALL
uniref:AMP-dependent synthetase/ligase domain-containing protein n=1 Tax=Dendroctonus ponderosae TaxID=77166 RepID=A0AAR5P8T8_DENPD